MRGHNPGMHNLRNSRRRPNELAPSGDGYRRSFFLLSLRCRYESYGYWLVGRRGHRLGLRQSAFYWLHSLRFTQACGVDHHSQALIQQRYMLRYGRRGSPARHRQLTLDREIEP